jgi:hypothetical protein
MTRPYNVFTHLIGSDGQLVGQQDNMPLRDTAPTTCWIPGEVIADPYEILIGPDAATGEYVLTMGLYSWRTGERLLATGPSATLDHSVILSDVLIGGP